MISALFFRCMFAQDPGAGGAYGRSAGHELAGNR